MGKVDRLTIDSGTVSMAGRQMASGPAIATRSLAKSYATSAGETVDALAQVSFDVGQGEFVSLVGPSGCGKTTLMRILAGLVGGYAGSVSVEGRIVHGPTPEIGVVFQDANLMPWRTVLANVMLPGQVLRLDKKACEARARELLALVGLVGFESKLPGELSGGMRQRAAIARALLHDPRDPADGRAVRRARRHDARQHECRAGAHRRRSRQDGVPDHPLDRRSRCSCPTACW